MMRELWTDLSDSLDLTDAGQRAQLTSLADRVLDLETSPAALQAEEDRLFDVSASPLMARVAIKLARSRALLLEGGRGFRLSVVFAVYKEHTRILTQDEHPHGEDFLREKIRQLRWLFAGLEGASWDLTVVDDGCPEESGRIAEGILEDCVYSSGESARVRYLADAIEENHPAVRPLRSTDDSRKGGSILLGMAEAVALSHPDHIVLFTDADLSTHLGQAGLLVDPLLRGGYDVAIGSRREPTSVAIKRGTRNLRGKLFIYLWKRLFAPLGEIVDTQCGFKAFRAETVRDVVMPSLEKQFAFDIELLLKAELRRPSCMRKIPVAWIDSEAASTTTDLQPYLPMLKKMASMYRHYLPPEASADAFADLLDELDAPAWDRLVDSIPAEITQREPHTFGRWDGVSARELRERAGLTE